MKKYLRLIREFHPREKIKEYMRILKKAKKPSKEEFKKIIKISGAGIILIGLIGFMIQITFQILQGMF